MRTAIAAACIVLALAAGCSLLNPDGGKFKPKGTPFALNPDIQVTSIVGSDTGYSRFGNYPLEIHGLSQTGNQATDTLVGGLFLVSLDIQTQHIVIIKPQVVSFGAAETSLVIGGFCCNPELDAPEAEDDFEIGPVTDNADLQKIVDICADRDVTYSGFTVQMAVWQVTDGDGLTAAMEDSLRDLPPDSSLWGGGPSLPGIRELKSLRPGR
jgi:hypothetical protein